MAISLDAANQPGAIPGCRVVGIMSLKPNVRTAGQYAPAPHAWGPICERCWMEQEYVLPESSAYCPHGGAS
jgi:hypothetical protein